MKIRPIRRIRPISLIISLFAGAVTTHTAHALEEVYKLYKELYQPIPHPSPAAIQTQLTWMAERDPRAKAAKPEQFLDATQLREIDKSGFVTRLYQR